jgi:hypothetical protein
MTPDELEKIRGRGCACACQIGFNSGTLHSSGLDSKDCVCGCILAPFEGSAMSGYRYIHPEV